MNTQEHPAKEFGGWLREKRQLRGVVARVFARTIWLSHAKYAELELGVINWVSQKQELLIPMALELNDIETLEFNAKLKAARETKRLTFSDIFSNREALRPIRACHQTGKQLTKEDSDRVLDVIFAPLS